MRRTPTHRRQSQQSTSPSRAPGYERPGDISAPSEKFFNSRVRRTIVCPETALMYAVLEDALLCYQKQFGAEPRFVQRAWEAEDWFFSDDSRRLFSFVSVCYALGLETAYIRKRPRLEACPCRHSTGNKILYWRGVQSPRFRDPTIGDRPSPLNNQTVVVIIVGFERRHDDDSTNSSSR